MPPITWTRDEAQAVYDLPFNDLIFRAQTVHRAHFDPNRIQKSQLLSIKTGGCPEDCAYCSQSAHHNTGLSASKLIEVEGVLAEARRAREAGATRYCMGAAWRNPKQRDMAALKAMVEGGQGNGYGNLHDARHAEPGTGRWSSSMQALITTITISIHPSGTMARSSPRDPSPTVSTHWQMSVTPA